MSRKEARCIMRPAQVRYYRTQRLGRRLLIYDQIDSTNDRAAELAADPSNDGVVILARAQAAGRGQHGHTWTAPAGTSVLLSVLLFPPPALRRPALLTAWAAVSVCETILHSTGLQAKIKWPNDVLIRGRKVCGILIEQRAVASGPSSIATICGIGLNLNQSAEDFAATGLEQAGSLRLFTQSDFNCEEMARLLIGQLDEEYDRLCHGDLHALESSWQWRLGLLGKQVIAECHHSERRGRLIELGWDGVVLDIGEGLLRLVPEAVHHLYEMPYRNDGQL
jgi:BirA family biotin operon repressor/biotin-[acetyl-CoA-carboxylase] ligase